MQPADGTASRASPGREARTAAARARLRAGGVIGGGVSPSSLSGPERRGVMFTLRKLKSFERGLYFRDGDLEEVVGPGWVLRFDPLGRSRLDVVSVRSPWLLHKDL